MTAADRKLATRERDAALAGIRRALATGDPELIEIAGHDLAVAASRWMTPEVSETIDEMLAGSLTAAAVDELVTYFESAEVRA